MAKAEQCAGHLCVPLEWLKEYCGEVCKYMHLYSIELNLVSALPLVCLPGDHRHGFQGRSLGSAILHKEFRNKIQEFLQANDDPKTSPNYNSRDKDEIRLLVKVGIFICVCGCVFRD